MKYLYTVPEIYDYSIWVLDQKKEKNFVWNIHSKNKSEIK